MNFDYVQLSYSAYNLKHSKINGSLWLHLPTMQISHGLHHHPSQGDHQALEVYLDSRNLSSFIFLLNSQKELYVAGAEKAPYFETASYWEVANFLVDAGWSISIMGKRNLEEIADSFARLAIAHDQAIQSGEIDW